MALRVSVEENDMLTFNNQRLTKRVEQLMLQLQEQKQASGSGWGGFFSGSKTEIARLSDDLEVLKEQLQQKLEENEKLVSQMFQLRDEHEQTISVLDQKLVQQKKVSNEKEDSLTQNAQTHSALISELNDEKGAITTKVSSLEKEIENARTSMLEREQTMTTINRQLSTDLERTQRLFDHKVAFDDTRVTAYNNLNCPGFDRIQMVRKIEICESFLTLLDAFNKAYSLHDTAMRDRLTLMGRNITADSKLQRVNGKMIELLPEHVKHLESLREACSQALLSMKATLDIKVQQQLSDVVQHRAATTVGKHFKRLVAYHMKVLPYELLSLMEEARKDNSLPVLQARNYVLIATRKRFVAALEKLAVYVHLALSTDNHTRAQEANAVAILNNANTNVAAVYQAYQAYTSHLVSKLSQEHRGAFVSGELKAVNEKMLNTLSNLTAVTGKMVELMNDYTNSNSSAGVPCTVRGVECDPLQMSEDLARMQARARYFFGNIIMRTEASRATRLLREASNESVKTVDTDCSSHERGSNKASPPGSPGHGPTDGPMPDGHVLSDVFKS